jgi:hypothetical protein
MNTRIINSRFFAAWLAAFVLWFSGTYIVNAMLIDYSAISQTFRRWDDELSLFPVLIAADLLLTGSLVWFYARLVQPKLWLSQGLVYGLRVHLFVVVPMYTRNFVAQPETPKMLVQQIVFLGIVLMLIGAVVAFIYRAQPGTLRGVHRLG